MKRILIIYVFFFSAFTVRAQTNLHSIRLQGWLLPFSQIPSSGWLMLGTDAASGTDSAEYPRIYGQILVNQTNTWFRGQFVAWTDIERSPGVYVWTNNVVGGIRDFNSFDSWLAANTVTNFDATIAPLPINQPKIMFSIFHPPAFATNTQSAYIDAETNIVKAILRHAPGRIWSIEFGNEPWFDHLPGCTNVQDVALFWAHLAIAVRTAVHDVDPTVLIAGPSLSSPYPDDNFASVFSSNGGYIACDLITFHDYRMSGTSGTTNDPTFTPTDNPPGGTNLAACAANLNGWSGRKPIFVSELGLGIYVSNVIAYVTIADHVGIAGLAPTYFLGSYNNKLNTVGYWDYTNNCPAPNGAAYIATMKAVNPPAADTTYPTAPAFNEWYGPFPSWTNVMAFGAACDGTTDDSTAVSNALAAIGNGTCSPVLLIPGMCRVTKKPWLNLRKNVAVVGLNQNTCGFLYDGPTVPANDTNNSGSATCFHVDGVVDSYFARLKFDGNFKARTVLASSQQQSTIFDNNNLYEDCIIKNSAPGGIGIDGGHFEPWEGFSNEDFVRCLIQTNSIGVETENYNALDAWFTDCLFESNTTYGIYIAKGDAHAYHSFFQHNGIDFYNGTAGPFNSLVSNVSYQSGAFYVTASGLGANNTPTLLKGNTVIDPAGIAYQENEFGPLFMVDNTTLTTNATISFTATLADFLAVGNTNGVSNWATFSGGTAVRSNLVDNFVVNRASLTFALPGRPLAATNLNRTVFEMTTNMTSASLQGSIDSAADGCVFHIPSPVLEPNHQIYPTGTITIPTNKDVRIVGDGADTILFWNGSGGSTFFSCPYPSHATFSHIALVGNYGGAAKLISVSGVGSTAARVYVHDSGGQQPVQANIFMGNCSNTLVDVYGLGFGGGNEGAGPPATNGDNVVLSGAGKLRYINADGGGNAISYVSTNGGQLYVENSYNEASNTFSNRLLRLSGGGTVTFLGSKMVENIGSAEDFSRATSNGFALVSFTGQLSFMGIQVIDWFNITNGTTGLIWIEGSTTWDSPVSTWPVINSTGDTPVQTMSYNFADSGGPGATRITEIGIASAAFTRQMLSQARTEYSDRTPMMRRTNQTDVLLEQVFFQLGTQNLTVTP